MCVLRIHWDSSNPPCQVWWAGYPESLIPCLFTFLASADGASLVDAGFATTSLSKSPYLERDFALNAWKQDLPLQTPLPASPSCQKVWEKPRVLSLLDSLLLASDQESRARPLVASSSESGAWLHVPPISSLGLRTSHDTLRVVVGLGLGHHYANHTSVSSATKTHHSTMQLITSSCTL